VGALGLSGCFSFYPTKNLGAYGEGGALVTNDQSVYRAARTLRDHGQSRRYYHDTVGYNYRMDGVQGAVLRVKLRHLEAWTEARRRIAASYGTLLAAADVTTPTELPHARAVYHLYVVRTETRDALRERLREAGIATGIHYPVPCHLQRAYADLGHTTGDFPHAERGASTVLSLPMFAELTDSQVADVAIAVSEHIAAA
jgi:dTDP-4-amino-4,6-dideoxygalactose transaminase